MLKKFINKIKKHSFRNMEPYDIDMEELKCKQSKGAKIVDVRSSQEYNECHIEGAINIPEYEINCNIDKILKNQDEEIVLYCSSGNRSKNAYKKLKKLDYKNVYNLYGGLEYW